MQLPQRFSFAPLQPIVTPSLTVFTGNSMNSRDLVRALCQVPTLFAGPRGSFISISSVGSSVGGCHLGRQPDPPHPVKSEDIGRRSRGPCHGAGLVLGAASEHSPYRCTPYQSL